jgi:hypothetical protein
MRKTGRKDRDSPRLNRSHLRGSQKLIAKKHKASVLNAIQSFTVLSLGLCVACGDSTSDESLEVADGLLRSSATRSVPTTRRITPARTEMWMHPNKIFTDRIQSMDSFLFGRENLRQWESSFGMMDGYQVHIQSLEGFQDPQFAPTLIRTLVEGDKKIVLTAGGLDANACNVARNECLAAGGNGLYSDRTCAPFFDQVGQNSAQNLISVIEQSFYFQGRLVLDILSVDGGMKRAMGCSPAQGGSHCSNVCQFPVRKSIEQMTEYFRVLHARYPSLKFDYLFNFLNWNMSIDDRGERLVQSIRGPGRSLGMDADLRFVLTDLVASMRSHRMDFDSIANEGGAFFYFNEHWDPNYPQGEHTDWFGRLVALRRLTDQLGIKTHQAINVTKGMQDCAPYTQMPDVYARCALNRDRNAQIASVNFVRAFQRKMEAAGFPKNAEVMDTMQWKKIPEHPLPENRDYTYMRMFQLQMEVVGR